VLKVKIKVKGHVIRALSWIIGMSYSVIDGLVILAVLQVISFHLPEKTMEMQAKLIAAMAWKAGRLRHIGASVMETHCTSEQTANSSVPLTWSNSGPTSNVPTILATPVQMSIVDISCVLLDVQTSMSGSDVVIIPRLAPCHYNDSFAYYCIHNNVDLNKYSNA